MRNTLVHVPVNELFLNYLETGDTTNIMGNEKASIDEFMLNKQLTYITTLDDWSSWGSCWIGQEQCRVATVIFATEELSK